MQIKNIIFDLGGVLVDIDYGATIKAFQKLGINNFDEFFSQLKQNHLFDKWDIGKLTPKEFRDDLRKISGLPMTDEAIDGAWNAMLGGFPATKIPMLDQVSKNYRTFLLSNTNAIHIPWFKDRMMKTHGIEGLETFFEKLYYSHEVGMRKPDVEIFQHVIDDKGLNPAETLFFDDTLMHVQGARRAGLLAYWIDVTREDVTEFFNAGVLTDLFMLKLQNQSS
jgi:putative hydrolase of the HAD superfamily